MMIVEYNGVTMRNCLTRDFEQEIVYDASSTDQLFCRYRMTFEGVITEAEAAPHVRSRHNPDSRAAVQLGVLRAALQAPRHTLTVKVVHWTYDAEGRPAASEERVLFQCHPEEKALADHHRDLSNGPKPKALKVLGVAGSRALRVSWTVECDMVELLYSADGEEHMGNETPPQPTAADRGSFLAVLVDRRYRERHAMARIDASHYWAGIQAALPMSDRIEGSAAAPLPPEPWLWQRHLPAGAALDALAAATGRRVVYDLSADRYRLQSHDDAVAAFDRNRQMAIDTSIASFAFDAPMGIGELSVSFPRALLIREGVATLHPEAARDRRLRALDGAAGWTAYCSLPVLYDTQGNVLNEGDIQAAATAIANYYDQWRNRAYQYHASLPPTARWELCGFDDYLWLSWDQDRRGRYFPKAIVSSLPPECLPIDWPWGGLPGEPSSSSSSSSSSGSEPPSGDSQSGGGGGCPDGTSATLDVLVADPTRSGGFLEFPKKRLVFSGGCLTAVEDREPLKVWVCCDSEPPPSSSDGSSEGSSEGSTDPDPFDPEQDWVVEDCETQQRVRLHASVGQQWQLGAVIDWEAAGISRRCGRLVGNNSWSAVAYDWTIHASYATCEECASGSSSSSSDGSSEPGEHDYVVEDCQTGTKSRIFVPVIAEVGQVIRWRLGPSGDPRCGVVKPSGTTPEETFYFGVDLLGLYSDCNSCLN